MELLKLDNFVMMVIYYLLMDAPLSAKYNYFIIVVNYIIVYHCLVLFKIVSKLIKQLVINLLYNLKRFLSR